MTAASADRPIPGVAPIPEVTPIPGATPVAGAPSVPEGVPGRPAPGEPAPPGGAVGVFDPLRLCIFSTVALLTWIFGPFAVLAFAVLGLAGYVRAHRAGLRRSRCYLRDVRLVLAYLGALAVVALVASGLQIASWLP